jgi:hypothetical protein
VVDVHSAALSSGPDTKKQVMKCLLSSIQQALLHFKFITVVSVYGLTFNIMSLNDL